MQLYPLKFWLRPLAAAAVLTLAAAAQEPTPPTPPPAPAESTPAATTPDATPTPAQDQPQTPAVPGKPLPPRKKGEYTGPTTVIELAPTPVLDGEGRQRLDPDGKPMFNAPIRQLRDKKGHPIFDDAGKPVFQTAKDLGYDDKGHKIDLKKEKEPKTVGINVVHGTFTVDGMTGKAALNYDIKDFRYFYLYVPWIGTTVVSNSPFPGSKEQKDAFNDKTLTLTVEDHTLQLYSDVRMLDKKPTPAYVLVDRDYKLPTRFPVVGYGPTARAPYAWPGSKDNKVAVGVSSATPVIPVSMRPVLLLSPCPTGQMRMPGPKPLPGETAAVQPCVAISKVIPATAPTPAPSAPVPPR